MTNVIKFGVTFQLSEHISEAEFQAVLDTVEFNSVFVKIESEIKKCKEAAQYYVSEAAKAAEFGSWNNKTMSEYIETARDSLDEIPRLLRWVVTQRFSDTDKHGNSYSQMRPDGLIVRNYALDVSYIFQ